MNVCRSVTEPLQFGAGRSGRLPERPLSRCELSAQKFDSRNSLDCREVWRALQGIALGDGLADHGASSIGPDVCRGFAVWQSPTTRLINCSGRDAPGLDMGQVEIATRLYDDHQDGAEVRSAPRRPGRVHGDDGLALRDVAVAGCAMPLAEGARDVLLREGRALLRSRRRHHRSQEAALTQARLCVWRCGRGQRSGQIDCPCSSRGWETRGRCQSGDALTRREGRSSACSRVLMMAIRMPGASRLLVTLTKSA